MQKEIKYVIRGSLRKRVLFALDKPNTPTELAKKLDTDRSSVSRSILFLCKKGILKCINPNDKRGRLYKTTPKGYKIREYLKDVSNIGRL